MSISANLHECSVQANGLAANGSDQSNGQAHDGDLGEGVMAKELVPTMDMDFVPENKIKKVLLKSDFVLVTFSVIFYR